MATDAKLSVVTEATLGNKGLVITVTKDSNFFGHLMIGRASIVWFEKSAKSNGRNVSWDEFHTWIMTIPETRATRPSS